MKISVMNGTIDRNDLIMIILNLFYRARNKQKKKKISNNRRFDNAFDKMITMDDCVMRKQKQ